MAKDEKRTRPFWGLSTKLITMIVVVILALEVIIFLPSLAAARINWLDNRLAIARVALQVIDAVPDDMAIPSDLADRLLATAGADAIAMRSAGASELIERSDMDMPMASVTIDLRDRNPLTLVMGGIDSLYFSKDRMLRIVGDADMEMADTIEVIMSEAPLRATLVQYARNIFLLSLTIALMTALVIFVFLNRALIRPIRRITQSMLAFRRQPENATLIITPSNRSDEIGVTERELGAMQSDLFLMLRQRQHLADLGLAVAKINHDLRNTLTSAQLLSDQVATLDDPKVQRLAPRLVHTLDRAIGFTQSVLSYGRESAAQPEPEPVDLRALIDECVFDAGLRGHPTVTFVNEVPDGLVISVDPDQMARVFVNLAKNAREALEASAGKTQSPNVAFECDLTDDALTLVVADNGPGLPPRAKENLFVAFEGSAKSGGTGLGLAIARELTQSNGGRLDHVETDIGTRFTITFPRSFLIE